MAAGVVERVQLAGHVAREDDALIADRSDPEVARRSDLFGAAEIDPIGVPDRLELALMVFRGEVEMGRQPGLDVRERLAIGSVHGLLEFLAAQVFSLVAHHPICSASFR